MAIDTAEKRRSVSTISLYAAGPGLTPNSSKDIEWRQQSGWGYSGIPANNSNATINVVFFSRDNNIGFHDRSVNVQYYSRDINVEFVIR